MGVAGVHDDLNGADRMSGYIPYYIYTDQVYVDQVSTERVIYAFYHRWLHQVVLLPAVDALTRETALGVINSIGEVQSLGKYCGNCGSRNDCLKKCSCARVRYCSKDCQRSHWPAHSTKCPDA
jgi:hypothetical protein